LPTTYAIIPAAGQGRRFGSAKQFQLLAGKPLFLHAVETFESSPLIAGICLPVPETDIESVKAWIEKGSLKKILKIVPGGKERQDSVRKGFEAIPPCDLIIVHDGVRPLVTRELIEKTIRGAQECGSCVVGLPLKETTKRVNPEMFIRETVDRTTLWGIQTPQAFRYEIFQKALEKAQADRFLGTDEAMLVERIGVKIKVIEGSPYNIKITTPEDLRIAESLLSLYKGVP
jgi:2-C-methyl-D-erythritol 4-phosphate cytidylyltransferase